MENKTYDTVERLRKFIDYKSISVRGFSKNVGISHCLVGRIKSIGSDKLEKILRAYPDINPEWLLTGHGPMLRPVEAMEEAPQTLEEPRSGYSKAREASCMSCQEKEKVIQDLENRLADKDKQIEDLKSNFEHAIEDLKINMERLISEKSEVVKMKDAMLAIKDQMLEMQAEKIAELESFKKIQEEQMRKQRSAWPQQ